MAENNKAQIIRLLKSTHQAGIDALIDYLETDGYFESPASTKYHGSYCGGLAQHSLNVYNLLREYNDSLKLGLTEDTLAITALLHDVCKVGLYIGDNGSYTVNKTHPKGHATLSLEIIQKFIELSELEEKMILYHMGVYGLYEFEQGRGEYPLRGGGLANAWYHHPAVKIMYFCDEIATLKEKGG